MKTNKRFKSSIFSLLFSEPNLLRELYCALDEVSLPSDAPVSINTLEDVLFMDFINDISFQIDGKLVVLIEHQSTINPNMALRLLMYVGRVYEKIVEGWNIYSEKLLKIPRPEFFVLYNGVDSFPEEKVFRLSEAFEELKNLGLAEKNLPSLELVVRVMNINEGSNKNIAARCKKLAEYSAFVAKERAFEKELGSREEAVKEAVKYCQKHDILREFLKLHAGEVLSMLYTEWNWDDAMAFARQEAREDGMEKGIEKGIEKGRVTEKREIARNLLAKGSTPEFVHDITGLDIETIKNL